MPQLLIENVAKTFSGLSGEKIRAVERVSLDLGRGELMALVGPSGSGKTTLLRLVAGLEQADSGTISLDGRPVNSVSARDRDIAMVFQSYALYPNMSVFDNLALGLKLRKLPHAEIKKRVREVGEMLGLLELLGRDPHTLSGGQRQRVALGRALARRPALLLLDEPLSGLDPRLRVEMRRELAGLQKQLGLSMLYVTHDQEEAMSLGQRVAVIDRGLIQQIATPHELYSRPRNQFIAEFFGSPPMNFFYGTITNNGTGPEFVPEGGLKMNLPEPLDFRLAEYAGKDIVLGARPEHIRIAEPSGSNATEMIAVLERIEMLGAQTHLHMTIGGSRCIARATSSDGLLVKEKVSLVLAPGHIHFFDRITGERIDS